MPTDIDKIREEIIALLKDHLGPLKITSDTYEKFEMSGTIEAMKGKKKVDGIYFSTVVPKPKDVRFYFFPAYSHKEQLGALPENLKMALKGKSCFHIKQMDDELKSNLRTLINTSIELYQKDGLLKK